MSRVLAAIDSSYWAMLPSAYETLRAIVESWAQLPHSSPRLSPDERSAAISAAQQARPSTPYTNPSSIAVISMFGVISPRMGMMDDMSQEGCALDSLTTRCRKAMSDPEVAALIINCDSPGGNVFQVPETADYLYSLREMEKRCVCVVTGMSASAAYWLAAQCPELVLSPSSQVGSIGIIMRHDDISKAAEEQGLAVTYITSPKGGYKAEGNPFSPLADETKEWYSSQCEEYYQMFLGALQRGRGVKAKVIDQDWGRGRMMGARAAVGLKMADRVGTLQAEIDRLAIGMMKKRPAGMRSEQIEELGVFALEAEGRMELRARLEEQAVRAVLLFADEAQEVVQVAHEAIDQLDTEGLELAKARLRLIGA